MNLIEFIIAIGQRLLSAAPLPGGSFTNPEFGVDIAGNWATLQPARDYWKARFDDLSGGTFSWSPLPDWMEFATQASSVDYSGWVARRNAIRATNQYNSIVKSATMRGRILPDLEALVAASEIAKFLGKSSSPATDTLTQSAMRGELAGLFSVDAAHAPAPNSDEARTLGRALRAARELTDAGQRFQFARDHAALLHPAVDVTFAELLALHRAEGASCMPPAVNSLLQAPLILTAPSVAPVPPRTEDAIVNLDRRSFSRPGYVPTLGGPVVNSDLRDLLAVMVNALTLGGLDNIVSWPIEFDNAHNELALLVNKAAADDVAGLGTMLSGWVGGLAAGDHPALARVTQGVAMAHFEADASLSGDALMARVVADLTVLRTYAAQATAGGGFSILDDDVRTHTKKFLEIARRWYTSRTRPETLLAHRDRNAFLGIDRLSPYMSYLRYHSGDVIFMGLLLRTAKSLPTLMTKWTQAMRRRTFAAAIGAIPNSDFGAALDTSFFSIMTAAEKTAISSALTVWKRASTKYVKGQGESVWRHVGLLNAIPAPWKPAPPSPALPDTKHAAELADAVLGAMTAMRDNALLEPISRALEYMPVGDLFSIPAFNEKNWAANLRKTENFERLRLFIDDARTNSSLDEMGRRNP